MGAWRLGLLACLLTVGSWAYRVEFEQPVETCGYESCPQVKDGMINVHLVPHTHDDVGWLKTVDQYYYGSRNNIQNAGVQYIIDSVIPELIKDPSRRFIYVEIAFFARWWREQNEEMRLSVKELVDQGRLEFILGGWCMNDEAATHYNAIIDQHSLGFEFLRQNFGKCGRPRIGWQIDPFGHSREQASLFAQFGFDGLFFGRLDYQDKDQRMKDLTMEMLWHGSPKNLGEKSDLFTGVLYTGYGPPGGFCWDEGCSDDPMMDDPRLHDYNVDKRVADFIKAVNDQVKHYATDQIMMTMGSDFQYQNAAHWYKNMDKLIKYTNELQATNGSKVNVLYSTPSCYLYQLNLANKIWTTKDDDFFPYGMFAHGLLTGFFTSRPALKGYVRRANNFLQQVTNGSKVNVLYSTPSCYVNQLNHANKIWPSKDDDFFPYASRADSFWTGYFTSRTALKGYVRRTNNFLQVCTQMDALAKLEDTANGTHKIQVLKEAMGVVQHHDGVSGTEKQEVAYDYAERLAHGTDECQKVVNDAYSVLMPKAAMKPPVQTFCSLTNISYCEFTEVNKEFVMTVYNPLGHEVTEWIRLPVIGDAYTVTGPEGEELPTQVISVSARTKEIPERKGSMALNDLVFQVTLPVLGWNTYFIKKMTSSRRDMEQQMSEKKTFINKEDYTMSNEHMSLTFDAVSGQLKSMKNLATGVELPVKQDIVYYPSHPGNCSESKFQPSGAYIFRPNTTKPVEIPFGPGSGLVGPLVEEVYSKFTPWMTQVVRMYKGAKYAELEYTIGPIPIKDNIGKEVIVRFNSDLKTNELFYTDANGREILQRKRNYRPTWKLNQTEPVAGNYYPVNSRAYLQDMATNTQFTVLTDRSFGGASIEDGELEIMVHRRMLFDDCLGVGEPLNETGSDGMGLIVRGKLYIYMDTIAASARLHREMALRLYMAPSHSFATTEMKQAEWDQNFHSTWSGMTRSLPPNVHMLTLEQWAGPGVSPTPETQPYLLRLEHFYEKDEDPEMSQPATVLLGDLFVPFKIASIDELTLGANLLLSELHRLKWRSMDGKNVGEKFEPSQQENPVPEVVLNPMEIRTFQVVLEKGNPLLTANKFDVFS